MTDLQNQTETSGVLVTIGRDHYQTDVETFPPRHEITADEPGALGGSDKGPSPFELLYAAVGTCKAITCRMYADRKEWPVERIEAKISMEKRQPAGAGPEDPVLDHMDVEMRFVGDQLTEEQLARLLDISERCPVAKTVTGDLRIISTLAK